MSTSAAQKTAAAANAHVAVASNASAARPSHSLTPEEAYAIEHAGHEQTHATMALILLGSLIFSQMAIMLWKRYHDRSFRWATLCGLWIVPAALGLRAGNARFVTVWALFSVANAFVMKKALAVPMKSTTPGIVYNICYALGLVGYLIVLVAFFHVPVLVGVAKEAEVKIFEMGIILLFYGLYFGTLGRDFVDRLSDRMATNMGFYSKTGFPRKHVRSTQCAICGDSTDGSPTVDASGIGIGDGPSTPVRKVHRLNCGHTFHERCIRGWTIIGKKDVCPCCKEKVDLKAFKKNPWDTTQIMYLNLLDALRYVIV
ncbi:hypothetical protein HK104_003676 [Borealophlyctis nickersoniae]|nr:hypothetical protein HK104_003676 [Borealophlyctis nickersoniae]